MRKQDQVSITKLMSGSMCGDGEETAGPVRRELEEILKAFQVVRAAGAWLGHREGLSKQHSRWEGGVAPTGGSGMA